MSIQEGRAARDEALDRIEGAQRDWLVRARSLAVYLAQQNGTVSVNDLRSRLALPPGAHPNTWGGVFRFGGFVPAGYIQAAHKAAHARVVRVYRLAAPCR